MPTTRTPLIIRCATPDCDWGFPVASTYDEQEFDKCRDAFRLHCIELHGLDEDDREAFIWLNIEHWTMELR